VVINYGGYNDRMLKQILAEIKYKLGLRVEFDEYRTQFIVEKYFDCLPKNIIINEDILYWLVQQLLVNHSLNDVIGFANNFAKNEITNNTVNLLHANAHIDSDESWLMFVNRYLLAQNTYPVSLEVGTRSRFERLYCKDVILVSKGPLISVIMPVFNAEKTLVTATRSILNQSWQPLELIIVDDNSTDNSWQLIEEMARNDSRIKCLKNKVNVGPYVCKNLALRYATGDFITCHDADDWAHPLRLEKHVIAVLQSEGKIKASVTNMLRIKETGEFSYFSRIGPKMSFDGVARLSAVSNLFEAKFFYEQLGSWDCVRFGADSEIMGRVECLNNSGFVRWNNLGISMFCLDLDSGLTNHHQYGIDKVHGVSEPRKHYAASIRKWHQQVRLSQDGYLDFPSTTRRFDAPELGVVSLRDINYNLTYCYNQEYE
jgi:glycosyltransferase involved in cell wall biosynthesis